MNQDGQTLHGKRVSHDEAHEVVKRAAVENSNAGFYVPQFEGKFRELLLFF